MKKSTPVFGTLVSLFILACYPAYADIVSTSWGGDAEIVYDTGFMHMLMKHPDGGVCLFNMDLIENDAPGSAHNSEKGTVTDNIWGENHARKILFLDDPRTYKAWLVTITPQQGIYPLKFTINGHESQIDTWDQNKARFLYRWTEFPAQWLRKGKNVIDLFCPEAKTEEEGWTIYISRADEFENGGGDPTHVGGKRWKESPFGSKQKDRCEYVVRLSLDRYVKSGRLSSPVIDLWKGDSDDFIVPQREIHNMRLTIDAEVPEGTKIEYYLRKGTNPQPFSVEWEPYKLIGSGSTQDITIGGIDLNRRYVQFKAVLSADNALKSPIVKSVRVSAELLERVPLHDNIHVVECENPPIKYSSIEWEWEKWDRPEFAEVRERENLDEVIAGSRTEFDAQVKLLDYVSKRYRHGSMWPEYPNWDALSILNRIEYKGTGGFCLTFNALLAGMCMAYGWQGRLAHVCVHEVCEVWNDDYGKWIFLDADKVNSYNYFTETAEPLNMHELHNLFLDYYFPDRPMDWMNDLITWMPLREDDPPPVKLGSLTDLGGGYRPGGAGFINAAYTHMVPRNNWYEKPYPKSVNHCGITPWDGFIHWYDDRTPPKRQFSLFTDRPRDMWPDLN